MSTIIVGHFEHVEQRDSAVAALAQAGFAADEVSPFYLNPPGQHGLRRFGGDTASDEGASSAGKGATAAAAVGGADGLAIGSMAGPIGAIAGAGVGAYVGSLAGALGKTHEPKLENATAEHPVAPPGGPAIAVCVDRAGCEASAIDILKDHDARQIEREQGTWADGECIDCEALTPAEILFSRPHESIPTPRAEP